MPSLGLSTGAYVLIGLVAFFASVMILVASASGALLERRQIYRGLRNVRAIDLESSRDVRRRVLAAPATSRILIPAMRRLADIGRRVTPASVVERLEEELSHAGNPPGWDAARILAFKVLLPLVLLSAIVLLGPIAGLDLLQILLFGLFFAVVGYYLPEWVLRSKAGKRQATIQRSLADALDLLSITVEAGLGFDAALSRVAQEIGGPLGQELHRVVQEVQLGEERIDALRGLADRNTVPELKSFVLAMIQADILGIAVSNVLQVQAKEIRLKRRQRAEEKAQKLPVKIVFPLIFCIFPALFVVLLGPAVITIWENIIQAF